MRSSLVAIVVGLAVGLASGRASAEEPAPPEGPRVRVTSLVGLAVSHGEKWETTSPDRRLLAITPTRGGAAFRLSFAF